jgi:uncharacterized membrane protein YqaE (UPF0057 family)
MKKLFAPILLLVITGILFSSCSNTSKLTFAKRHYRSGYYVNLGGKSNTVIPASHANTPAISKHTTTAMAKTKPEGYSATNAPVIVSEKPVAVTKIATPKKIQENNLIGANSALVSQKTLVINTGMNNDVSGSVGDGHRDNVSVPFVVIVLCAIFIPPLGVGLMYGINSYFWIDLILTLLFFFPGMIFAIIVVLM